MLKEGDKAPELSGLDQNGRRISLAGKKVVLYFYPKDDTPGCTVEACAFRDSGDEIRKRGWEVAGVSTDGVLSHKQFEQKHRLNFPLLADSDKGLARTFGVLAPMGYAQRVTFLVGANGLIRHVFPKVSPKGHAEEVLGKIDELEKYRTLDSPGLRVPRDFRLQLPGPGPGPAHTCEGSTGGPRRVREGLPGVLRHPGRPDFHRDRARPLLARPHPL